LNPELSAGLKKPAQKQAMFPGNNGACYLKKKEKKLAREDLLINFAV